MEVKWRFKGRKGDGLEEREALNRTNNELVGKLKRMERKYEKSKKKLKLCNIKLVELLSEK